MNITTQAQAVLLLTAYFSKPEKDAPRPLTPTEWGRFAHWLKGREINPGMLLIDDVPLLLDGWVDRTITLKRIRYLLGRAGALGLALEKWQRAGLWVLTRSDSEYPARLKKHLKNDSPPVLFGCGNRNLLNLGGIGVIGSRDASPDDIAFTANLGQAAARQGLSIVSGGARGVDETAMLAALEHEGTSVGILADSLLRAATSAKYRKALMRNKLVLISPFSPEAGFDVGNAMARNKYIYCLCDAAIVITSTQGKGGTWNGAVEDLRNQWTPLWVKHQQGFKSGNGELVRLGAHWLPEGDNDLSSLISVETSASSEQTDKTTRPARSKAYSQDRGLFAPNYVETPMKVNSVREEPLEFVDETKLGRDNTSLDNISFYELFLRRFKLLSSDHPQTLDELLEHLDINKTQLLDWLKLAQEKGCIEKLKKPVRYRQISILPKQCIMFEE